MLAKFIEDEVLLCAIRYEKKLHKSEKLFILGLLNSMTPEEFTEKTLEEYKNIDHSYMQEAIAELQYKIAEINSTIDLQRSLPNKYELVPVSKLKSKETQFSENLISNYTKKYKRLKKYNYDLTAFLTTQIKDYRNIEKFIPYFKKDGTVASMRTLSDYNSMLYNMNLTKSGWNQTFKDAEILENDLLILNGHPHSCDICASHQGKVYSLSGKSSKYPSVELAEDDGVGHPNCKCEWSIYWDSSQKNQTINNKEDYENHTKLVAIDRELRYAKTEKKLFEEIGNFDEADKTKNRIKRLNQSKKQI